MACCRYRDRTSAQRDADVERLRIELRAVFLEVYACIEKLCERVRVLESADPAAAGGAADQLDADGVVLDVNAIADGRFLQRSGTTVVGTALAAVATSGSASDLAVGTIPAARLPASASQATIDFGSTPNDYAEVTISATWATTSHKIAPTVRGGTTDHPLADEDAAIEQLHATIVAIVANTSVTVGVHAPNTTTGQYIVDILGAA